MPEPMTPEPGEWWYGARCIGCDQFLHQMHDSGASLQVNRGGWLELTCGACQRRGRYKMSYLERRQYLPPVGWGPIESWLGE
jgi:hypothetical protein